jgi:NAD(P)-dependent dehydrogenase (short-subunit alcohol dehydrogenase family)
MPIARCAEDQRSLREEQRPVSEPSLRGRVCVVTGANRGIGKATAVGLARRGATVVMLCRDSERCRHAADDVQRATGRGDVAVLECDLASLAAVRRTAAALARRHPALHVLVNNAGVSLSRRATSADGFEMTFAVNHLGPFLLTDLLLPTLRAGAPARVINVASAVERLGRIHFDDLQLARRYGALRAYAQSKLANVLFTYELADRLAGTNVTVNCVHPGLVATDLLRDWPRWMRRLWEPFLRTPDEAARALVWLAAASELDGVTGRYFDGMRVARSSARSYDRAARSRLWQLSAELVGGRRGGGLTPGHAPSLVVP